MNLGSSLDCSKRSLFASISLSLSLDYTCWEDPRTKLTPLISEWQHHLLGSFSSRHLPVSLLWEHSFARATCSSFNSKK